MQIDTSALHCSGTKRSTLGVTTREVKGQGQSGRNRSQKSLSERFQELSANYNQMAHITVNDHVSLPRCDVTDLAEDSFVTPSVE